MEVPDRLSRLCEGHRHNRAQTNYGYGYNQGYSQGYIPYDYSQYGYRRY